MDNLSAVPVTYVDTFEELMKPSSSSKNSLVKPLSIEDISNPDGLMMPSSENSLVKTLPIEDIFNPYGLKVLVVDNNGTSLLHLTTMLVCFQYQVTTCSLPNEALELIKENKFDIVITEVHFAQDIDGVKFLEIIIRETGLPVVVVSADERIHTMVECMMKGACTYIPKPATKEVIQLLWQHVARARMEMPLQKLMKPIDQQEINEPSPISSVEDKEFNGSSGSDGGSMEDEQNKEQPKKNRINWTTELHMRFVGAVRILGIQKAVPKKILKLMNVPGLRRECVASHLQKYRLSQKSKKRPQGFREQIFSTHNACSPVFEDNNLLIRTQRIAETQHFTVQDSINHVPSGAYIPYNGSFISTPVMTEMQHPIIGQDSSIKVDAYRPVSEPDNSPAINPTDFLIPNELQFDPFTIPSYDPNHTM